jgi:hypothetical protein
LSKRKRVLYATIVILMSLSLALVATELILRFLQRRIQSSEHLDPGLMLYDKRLGWKLTPNWKGRHKHYDFDVSYSTNPYGFRGNFKVGVGPEGSVYAFVGNSFTFGLGVNDNEVFVHLLNAQENNLNTYLNFSVLGFSTDQELLLIQERVFDFSPDVILLLVYLGNDLFDNELSFPLQANNAKPYFKLGEHGLILKNTPVPFETKPKEQMGKDLTKVVLGDEFQRDGFIFRHLNRFQLFRLLKLNVIEAPDLSHQFDERFEHALRLFTAIIDRLRNVCDEKGVKLSLILMPGSSFVQRPDSPSAQFQDYLRGKILANKGKMGVDVIDLAGLLREAYQQNPGKWFYPNEGHLTPEGHRIVADMLATYLR